MVLQMFDWSFEVPSADAAPDITRDVNFRLASVCFQIRVAFALRISEDQKLRSVNVCMYILSFWHLRLGVRSKGNVSTVLKNMYILALLLLLFAI